MSNSVRGEVTFDLPAVDESPARRYQLKFNNAGRKAMESEAGISQPEIDLALSTGRVGATILSAMLWGATRMHHSNHIRNQAQLNGVMDQAEDAEVMEELTLSLMAAYARRSVAEIREEIEKAQSGDLLDEADMDNEETGGTPDASLEVLPDPEASEAEAPKEATTKKKKAGASLSGVGTNS